MLIKIDRKYFNTNLFNFEVVPGHKGRSFMVIAYNSTYRESLKSDFKDMYEAQAWLQKVLAGSDCKWYEVKEEIDIRTDRPKKRRGRPPKKSVAYKTGLEFDGSKIK